MSNPNNDNLLSMRVYVVDDDSLNIKILKRTFENNGFTNVHTFLKGEELIEALENKTPDLILLDIVMPGMNGYQVLEKVKDNPIWNHIPVIMLTGVSGTDETEALKHSFEKGAMDYITKPYKQMELILRVKSALTIEKQRQDLRDALAKVKTLENLLPICSYCKKIRNDKDYWQDVEVYISEHTDTLFSHSICPDCYEKYVKPQMQESIKKNKE